MADNLLPLRVDRLEIWEPQPPLSSAEVKNGWICPTNTPCAFMAFTGTCLPLPLYLLPISFD
jgi:hypothetical protein